jgi:phage terminase Nu1 subunit (DNA packaging protein)
MSDCRSHRWFQLSLKSLFLLTLLVATFFAGYSLATRQAEAERRRAELEAQRAIEEARLQAEEQALQTQRLQAWSSTGTVVWPQQQRWIVQPQSKE